jgi:hypothetical protein
MLRISAKSKRVLLLLLLAAFACPAYGADEALDSSRYITVDEIRPGMEAYCLTVYKGTQIEKFDLDVLDVVRDWRVGKDGILVRSTDERFLRTGPVAGCSGSPVYIDGRLAGALAWGTIFSKDPFYIVTPIEEMLRVGSEKTASSRRLAELGYSFDFSGPLDFAEIEAQLTKPQGANNKGLTDSIALPCPLVVSGLPAHATEGMDALVRPFGLRVVVGAGGSTTSPESKDIQLEPGATLVVRLVSGDIRMDAIGTVTEVVGEKVYGFGHSMLGYGPIDLPMATGRVHTIVSNMLFSYKFGSAVETIGALRADEATAVYGQIGARARTIPTAITVDRYNDAQPRTYNCHIADNRLVTPTVLRLSLAGATLMLGRLPPDHMIEYKVTINMDHAEPISFENLSTGRGLDELITESMGSVALMMNNPYKPVNIQSIQAQVRITPYSKVAQIWSADLSDSTVKAGDEVKIGMVVESVLAEKKKYESTLKIPEGVAPGKYSLIVCGGYGYLQFLAKAAPHRFTPENLSSLVDVINYILHVRRDDLYCLLLLPAGGVTVEGAELPDLPATKTLVLQDPKRALTARPYKRWVEKSLRTGTVVVNQKTLPIIVED